MLTIGVMNLFIPVAVPLCKAIFVVESAYQSIVMPAKAVALIVAVSCPHFVAFVIVATVAGKTFTVAITVVRVADSHEPLFAAAKYVVVIDIIGVVNVFEAVANKVPAVAAEYQLIACPFPGVAEIVVVPVPHTELPDPIGAVGAESIEATAKDLVAETHPVTLFLEVAK